MSDTGAASAADSSQGNGTTSTITPYPSLPALHATHLDLLRLQRENGASPEFFANVSSFIQCGSATGVLLDSETDRETAQGLLDYWSTISYRAGYEPPDATLAEFNPELAPVLDDSLCPYVGLDAFREGDHAIFFGRQRMVEKIVELLLYHQLIALVGPSGSGKSSVVRAGVLPALRDGALPGSEKWRAYPPIVPGATPLASLARMLAPPNASAGWIEQQAAAMRGDAGQLARLIEAADPSTVVICVDQFEELYTLCEEEHERDAFIDNLLHLIDRPGARHSVILTMRSDFETFVARDPALQARFADARVPATPLNAAELREAIERPAAKVGLKFEDGVVESLLHDLLGEPAALPLLQFTLLKLWENRSRNRVTNEAYQRLGGGRLALARSADEFYAKLIPEEQVAARRILLRMIRPGDGLEVTSNRIRRSALYRASEAHDRIDRVLEKLIRARLVRVTSGDTPEDEQIEVAHEALVRNWPTLVDWLDDERAALGVRRRLEAKAAEWVRLGRGNSGLLDREQLLDAEHWLASNDAEYLGFDPTLPELVVWSRAAIEEAEQEQEQIRQRELEQAHALANEQQRRAEAERERADLEIRTNKRLTRLFRALAVAAIIAVGAAILAFVQAGRAFIAQQQAENAQQITFSQNYRLQTAVAETTNAKATAEANAQLADNNLKTAQTAQAIAETLRGSSESQQRIDRANLLAAVSNAVAQSKPQLSLLLAVEAWRVNQDANEPPVITATKALSRTLISLGANERGLAGGQAVVSALALSADAQRLVTGSADGSVQLWTLGGEEGGGAPVALAGASGPISKVAISPDGARLAAGGEDGRVFVWDASDPSAAPRELPGNSGPIVTLLWTPDGQRLIVSGGDNTIRVWRAANLEAAPLSLNRHTQQVRAVAISSDSRLVLSSGADGFAYLWDLSATNPVQSAFYLTPRANTPVLTNVALSPDRRLAAIGGEDGTIHIWRISGSNFSSGPTVLQTGTISALAIDPDNRWMITGHPDGTIRLWSLANMRVQYTLAGHTGPISALAFSQDGGRMVSSSSDGSARVWALSGGDPSTSATVLRGHEGPITALALGRDGARLVTGSADGSTRVWDLAAPPPSAATLLQDPSKLAELACSAAGRNLTPEEWQQYFDGKPYRKTCGP